MANGNGNGNGNSGRSDYLKCTRTSAAEPCDESTKLKGESVNTDSVRKEVTSPQPTLGPRTA